MAKNNLIFLIGSVKWIGYTKSPNTEDTKCIMCKINVIRKEDSNKKKIKSDQILIVCRDRNVISQMKKLLENDIIQVEGQFETMEIKKNKECTRCGGQVTVEYPLVYVNPSNIAKLVHCNTEKEALNTLLTMQ